MSLALILAAAASSQAAFASLDAIDAAASSFAGALPGMEGGPISGVDRRLRLSPCGTTLAATWFNARQETVVVQCPDAGWRVFVPVRRSTPEAAAPVVSRGDAVTIAVAGDGFAVSQPGEAMDGGAIGTWIRVRRAGASQPAPVQTLRGRVVRPGLVALDLP